MTLLNECDVCIDKEEENQIEEAVSDKNPLELLLETDDSDLVRL